MHNQQFALLKTKRFLPLFLTQALGAFNDNIFRNALAILITYRLATATGLNSQVLVAAAAGIFILPFFLFSATAGQLADKYDKATLITISKFAEIILMAMAGLSLYLENIPFLMENLFLIGTQAAFFGPLKYAILPEHLQENELIAGNGLVEAGTFIAILLGTVCGGLFILHTAGIFIITAMLLVIALIGWATSLLIPKSPSSNPALPIRYNFFKETWQLVKYSKQHKDLFLAILGISWFWLVGAILLSELPVFAKDALQANEYVVTFFLTIFAIGMAIGSLLCNKLLKGKVHATYVPLGALGMTLFMADLYFAAMRAHFNSSADLVNVWQFLAAVNGWRISLDLLLIAICGGIYSVPLYAILQHRSEKAYRARVIASNNIINALAMVISAIATMIMLKLGCSVAQVFLLVAVSNALVALYICKLLPDILFKNIARWILTSLYRVKVNGLQNYLQAGERVLIIANHTSFLDALLLATYLPDRLSFAVNTTIAQKWWIRLFLRLVDAFILDPTNPMALKALIEFMRLDNRCVIFPEGRITMTGSLMKIYEGPGFVADKSNAKLLPVHIQGAQYTAFSRLKGKIRIRWMPRITITVFPPQDITVAAELKGKKRRQLIGSKLHELMTAMTFQSSDYHKTLFSSLIDAKIIHGRRHEIIEDVERRPLSYQKFITHCFVLGGILNKNTRPGEYVGILLPNMISNAITFFALQAYCRVPAMLNYSSGIHSVITACETAKIRTVYSSERFVQLAKLTELIAALEAAGIQVIYLETFRNEITLLDKIKGLLFAQWPQLAYQFINRSKINQPLLKPDSPSVILFTSGSEGTPKGVVLSHSNIQANRNQLSACIDFTATDKVFNALPLFHSFGLTGGMLLPLLSGVRVFLYPSPLHYRIVPELVYANNATVLFGTDTFLAGYAKYAHPYDFYSVRYVFAGAEKLREETRVTWAHKFGVRIFEGYGATETSPVLAMNTPMQNKVGTVGRFLPGIHYQLKSIPGITDGGVLQVSGPNIMQGYLLADQPGMIVPPENGWYDTGDVVNVDEAGFVTIIGRVKRFAKIAGEMVSLTMVEQRINQLWPGYQHAVINLPHPKKGEQLVLATTFPNATREAITAYFNTHQLAEIALPRKIVILEEMPLLGAGKFDYSAIKQILAKQ